MLGKFDIQSDVLSSFHLNCAIHSEKDPLSEEQKIFFTLVLEKIKDPWAMCNIKSLLDVVQFSVFSAELRRQSLLYAEWNWNLRWQISFLSFYMCMWMCVYIYRELMPAYRCTYGWVGTYVVTHKGRKVCLQDRRSWIISKRHSECSESARLQILGCQGQAYPFIRPFLRSIDYSFIHSSTRPFVNCAWLLIITYLHREKKD